MIDNFPHYVPARWKSNGRPWFYGVDGYFPESSTKTYSMGIYPPRSFYDDPDLEWNTTNGRLHRPLDVGMEGTAWVPIPYASGIGYTAKGTMGAISNGSWVFDINTVVDSSGKTYRCAAYLLFETTSMSVDAAYCGVMTSKKTWVDQSTAVQYRLIKQEGNVRTFMTWFDGNITATETATLKVSPPYIRTVGYQLSDFKVIDWAICVYMNE